MLSNVVFIIIIYFRAVQQNNANKYRNGFAEVTTAHRHLDA